MIIEVVKTGPQVRNSKGQVFSRSGRTTAFVNAINFRASSAQLTTGETVDLAGTITGGKFKVGQVFFFRRPGEEEQQFQIRTVSEGSSGYRKYGFTSNG